MDSEPVPQPPQEATAKRDPDARVGPLELRRLRKDDGRSLLVFAHAADSR